ncbi:MAG: hypothetical protein KF805_07720 [Phycisphaeraceae bacterium]|nr:hypothetical protein [Phycisphaeraceae bacterium]
MNNDKSNSGSLIADLNFSGTAVPRAARVSLLDRAATRLAEVWNAPRLRNRLIVGSCVAILAGGGVAGYQYWRYHHQPDYALDPIDDLAEFTFLRSDFNSLPIKERLKLIKDFADRIRNASSGDSAILASFAAGISGKAREQIQENGARLMLDMVDSSAIDYAKVPPEERGAFLEKSVIEWTRIGDQVSGRAERTDEEILADIKKQTQQRDEMRKKMGPERSAKMAAGIVGFLNGNVANHANPVQSQRTLQMMSDVNKHFSGK